MARLDDGFSTTVTFSGGTSGVTLLLYEKEVTPPSLVGGGPNDITTMRNNVYRTQSPKKLISLGPSSFVASYDPAVYDEIIAMINDNQSIVVTFPDGSTLTFWGWIDEFVPGALVEGEQPTATVTIMPSNQNAAGNEIAPDYQAA